MTEFKLSMINWMNCIWSTDLPSQSKLIAAYLRSHMNDHHDIAWPSLSTIQGKTNLSRSTVVKYIDILCEREWLTRDKQTRTSTTYIASFPKSVENGLKVISNSTPDELAKLATSTCDELGSTCDELALVRETNSNKQSNKQDNKQDCFLEFWKNWIHCKKAIGMASNYGSKQDANAKWNKVFTGKGDFKEITDKMIDKMIEIYSDIHECQEQNKQSIYNNFVSMYPQKFIERAKEMVSE
jgi:DNA-binding MarR family transcriptional regulator